MDEGSEYALARLIRDTHIAAPGTIHDVNQT